jgi:Haem-binding domain
VKKKILLGLLAVLVIIQFIKPARNLSGDETFGVATKYPVPADVKAIMKVACNDCHTNKTEYPWYANWQPSAWWLNNHVKGGKKKLNLSEFTKLPVAVQNHKFEETIEMVKEKKMPISSYTWFGLHPEAKLTDEQRVTLTAWAQANMDSLKANYPADSLVMRRPKR